MISRTRRMSTAYGSPARSNTTTWRAAAASIPIPESSAAAHPAWRGGMQLANLRCSEAVQLPVLGRQVGHVGLVPERPAGDLAHQLVALADRALRVDALAQPPQDRPELPRSARSPRSSSWPIRSAIAAAYRFPSV